MSENKTEVNTVVHIGEQVLEDATKQATPILVQVGAELIGQLIGMAIDEVKKLCSSKGIKVRVASEDGKENMLSQEMDDNRVNLHIENGVVKAAAPG